MDQPVERRGKIGVPKREHLIWELIASKRENSVCDQQPPRDGGERRTTLLAGRF
jgi:hypothetical protein